MNARSYSKDYHTSMSDQIQIFYNCKILSSSTLICPVHAQKLVSFYVLVAIVLSISSCNRKSEEITPKANLKQALGGNNSQLEPNKSIVPPARRALASSPVKRKALDEAALRWEELETTPNGESLLARQQLLAKETIASLGAGEELIQFLDFLTEKGAGDLRQSLIDSGFDGIFKGPEARNARDWLLTLEDKKLREVLCRKAGEQFQGPGFKDFFTEMGKIDHNSQAALLTGYCVSLAKSDPEGAVRLYKEMGYPQKIDNTGMADVMASFPPNTNFLKFATETKEDSMTLAKRSRSALLQNWAGVKPEEAAQYVLANSATSVNPDQMGVVIGTWAKQSPDAAVGWLNKAPVGKVRDEGMAALAKHSTASAPAMALDYAGQISDFDKRVATATQVFKEWEKTDRPAATAAWLKLFPDPGQ